MAKASKSPEAVAKRIRDAVTEFNASLLAAHGIGVAVEFEIKTDATDKDYLELYTINLTKEL